MKEERKKGWVEKEREENEREEIDGKVEIRERERKQARVCKEREG